MNKLTKYVTIVLVFLLLILIYSYKLFSSFTFHQDFTRDIYDILTIVQGKLSLIGPKSSFGGIYTGPYYYYLFIPIFFLTRLNIYSLLFFNMILFLSGLIIFFYIQFIRKKNIFLALLGTLIIGFTPIYLIASRGPWNGYTYTPFLLVFFIWLYYFNFNKSKISIFLIGFLVE